MEEKIYERQVTKLAISKRVIDEHQIDRHYKENDLMELYKTELEPIEPRPIPILPKDRLFASQLKRFDKLIYKYHEHDSLLENKSEETLNEEEIKAAWEEFEAEKVVRPVTNYMPQQRSKYWLELYLKRLLIDALNDLSARCWSSDIQSHFWHSVRRVAATFAHARNEDLSASWWESGQTTSSFTATTTLRTYANWRHFGKFDNNNTLCTY